MPSDRRFAPCEAAVERDVARPVHVAMPLQDLSLDEHVERLARLGRGVFDSYALAASA